jgi:hypothetical protein
VQRAHGRFVHIDRSGKEVGDSWVGAEAFAEERVFPHMQRRLR